MTPFETKCAILADAWVAHIDTKDENWQELIWEQDFSFPLAYVTAHDYATVTPLGKRMIESLWEECCNAFSIPVDGEYDSYWEWEKLAIPF